MITRRKPNKTFKGFSWFNNHLKDTSQEGYIPHKKAILMVQFFPTESKYQRLNSLGKSSQTLDPIRLKDYQQTIELGGVAW